MNVFQKIYWWFSLYTDQKEKDVGEFFAEIRTSQSASWARERLRQLMQTDLIRFNTYQEWKFKGYKQLRKSQRKTLYENADKLKASFLRWYDSQSNIRISPELKQTKFSAEKVRYLAGIMEFLRPGKYFEYQESAAFERLIRDPEKEKLIGDCNQICTLYLAFYSWKFPITDWQIKVLPEHVCLHYDGVDIECTSGSVKDYGKKGKILPTEEMITTNILDISESGISTHDTTPKIFEIAAKLVHLVSSERGLAEKNLTVAYHNLGIAFLKEKNFEYAASYFSQAGEPDQVQSVWTRAAQHFSAEKNFGRALKYAEKSGDRNTIEFVTHNQAVELLKQKKYEKSAEKFRSIGKYESEKNVWQNYLYELNQKVKNCQTIKDYRRKRSILKKMRSIAGKAGNQDMIRFCNDIFRQI